MANADNTLTDDHVDVLNDDARPDKPKKIKPAQPRREPAPRPQPICAISEERSLGPFDFLRRNSLVKARATTVLITSRGEYRRYDPDNPPTALDLLRYRARFLSEVDMSYHLTRLVSNLPCKGDAFGFPAIVDLHWRVMDPIKVVRDGIRDLAAAMEGPILAELRPVTREFAVALSEEAEAAANRVLKSMPEVVVDFGIEAVAFVQLRMDEAERDRQRRDARVRHYRETIASGDLDQFALRLAENPKDVAAVIELLIKERDTHRQDTVDFVTKLIESDAIERWQIDDQVRTVLQWLQENTNRVITGTDEARRARLGTDYNAEPPHPNGAQRPPA